jgi:hypothetical protein
MMTKMFLLSLVYATATAQDGIAVYQVEDDDRWVHIRTLEQWDTLTENLSPNSVIFGGFIYDSESNLYREWHTLAHSDWNNRNKGQPAIMLHSDDKSLAEEIGCDTKGRENYCFVVAKVSQDGKVIHVDHRNEHPESAATGIDPDPHLVYVEGSTPKPALLSWIEGAANMPVKDRPSDEEVAEPGTDPLDNGNHEVDPLHVEDWEPEEE